MPQNPKLLEQALLNRPEITGPISLPEGDPNAPEAQVLRFAGGMLGNQQPGDLPSTLGTMTTMSLPLLSKLAKLLPGRAAAVPTAAPELTPGFRMNMHEFEPVTVGQRPPINDEAANVAFSQMQRASAGKRPPITIDEMNQMMAANKPQPSSVERLKDTGMLRDSIKKHYAQEGVMSSDEVMKRMADLKKYRAAAAEERGHVIPFPTRNKE